MSCAGGHAELESNAYVSSEDEGIPGSDEDEDAEIAVDVAGDGGAYDAATPVAMASGAGAGLGSTPVVPSPGERR